MIAICSTEVLDVVRGGGVGHDDVVWVISSSQLRSRLV